MSKMPLGYRFRAWLLSYWFGSFEGGMVRDTWKRKFQQEERERIIKLLEEARDKCACYREVGMPICRHQLSVDEQIALIKGEK